MAEAEAEQADIARMPGGLLINFGTVDALDGMLAAGSYANQNGKPVVFDPVGVGATNFRLATAASEHFFRSACELICMLTGGGFSPIRATRRVAANGNKGKCRGNWRTC
jgi:hypothetical protein